MLHHFKQEKNFRFTGGYHEMRDQTYIGNNVWISQDLNASRFSIIILM